MGCGCGKKRSLPKAPAAPALPLDVVGTYRNVTDGALYSRNPRFHVDPGETIELDLATASHTVRWWIRRGSLVLEP